MLCVYPKREGYSDSYIFIFLLIPFYKIIIPRKGGGSETEVRMVLSHEI